AVRPFEGSSGEGGVYTDSGSLLNGQPLAPCGLAPSPAWTVPYGFAPRPAEAVREHVLAHAGAGRIARPAAAASCPSADFLVCDRSAGSGPDWEVVSPAAPLLTLWRKAALNALVPANAF